MVVHGVPSRKRDLYKLWEGSAPSLVFEITSRSTRSEDLGLEKGLYEFLGVREYVPRRACATIVSRGQGPDNATALLHATPAGEFSAGIVQAQFTGAGTVGSSRG